MGNVTTRRRDLNMKPDVLPKANLKPDRVEVFPRKDGWGFRVRAGNHQIIAVSESYTTRSGAVRGAKRAAPGIDVRLVTR